VILIKAICGLKLAKKISWTREDDLPLSMNMVINRSIIIIMRILVDLIKMTRKSNKSS